MKFLEYIGAITVDAVYEIGYFFLINMRYLANIIELLLPYVMYLFGQYVALDRGHLAAGGEIFIPMLCTMLVYYLREVANRCNKGQRIPIPNRRFTEVDEDGEVQMEESRLQEMILYVADLEDWLERKRWL